MIRLLVEERMKEAVKKWREFGQEPPLSALGDAALIAGWEFGRCAGVKFSLVVLLVVLGSRSDHEHL